MKLLIFNKENTTTFATRKGERTIRLNKNTGIIYLSRTLSDELELKGNERMFFAYDEENTKDWYLCKTGDESGFAIKNDKAGVRFSNKFLSTRILDTAKVEDYATFLVAKVPVEVEGQKYYKILVSSPVGLNVKPSTSNKKK